MNKEQCIQLTEEIILKAHQEFGDKMLPLFDLKIEFFNKGVHAGLAHFNSRRGRGFREYVSPISVQFNEVIMQDNSDDFLSTIIHEVSHHVTGILYPFAKQHHGREFKYVNYRLGGANRTKHNYDVSTITKGQRRYEYQCNRGCKTFQLTPHMHTKIVKGTTRRTLCSTCKGQIHFVRQVTL